MAASPTARRILQWRPSFRLGNQRFPTIDRAVHLVAMWVFLPFRSGNVVANLWVLDVENPRLMFIMGAVGLGLNLISAIFLHGVSAILQWDGGMFRIV
jgi:Co/Zn/Cd efflux system component